MALLQTCNKFVSDVVKVPLESAPDVQVKIRIGRPIHQHFPDLIGFNPNIPTPNEIVRILPIKVVQFFVKNFAGLITRVSIFSFKLKSFELFK